MRGQQWFHHCINTSLTSSSLKNNGLTNYNFQMVAVSQKITIYAPSITKNNNIIAIFLECREYVDVAVVCVLFFLQPVPVLRTWMM
jgi:hypothetical protein